MEVKQAVQVAKDHVADLFASEGITDIGLEEIEYDDYENLWQITIGFNRPWDQSIGSVLAGVGSRTYKRRTYKRIAIRDRDHKVLSVKNRTTSQEQ